MHGGVGEWMWMWKWFPQVQQVCDYLVLLTYLIELNVCIVKL